MAKSAAKALVLIGIPLFLIVFSGLPTPVAAASPALRPALIESNVEPEITWLSDRAGEQQSVESAATLRRRLGKELEPFAPLGLKHGPILYYPSLEIEAVATDNVRSAHADRIADIGLKVAPSMEIASDWVRHAFRLSVSTEHIFYSQESDYATTAADAHAGLRLDLKGGTRLDLETDYDLSEASGGSGGVPRSAVGLRRDQAFGAAAELSREIGRIDLAARTAIAAFVYSDVALADGGTEDNSNRDYIEPQVSIRAGYGLKPGLKPYIKLEYAPRLHPLPTAGDGKGRNSQGGAVFIGTAIQGPPLWTGDLAVKYEHRVYDRSDLAVADMIGLEGSLLWRPTVATTVAFTASSGLSENDSDNAGADPTQGFSLGITQLVRHDLAATGIFGIDLSGGLIGETTWTASLGLSWAMGHEAELIAGYEFTRFDSPDEQSSYSENRLSTGLRLRL